MSSMDATRRRGLSSLSFDAAYEAGDLYMLVPRFSICKVRSNRCCIRSSCNCLNVPLIFQPPSHLAVQGQTERLSNNVFSAVAR